MRTVKAWMHLISQHIPARIKSNSWLLWERRAMWRCCRSFNDFEWAYGMLRHFESTRLLLIRAERERIERIGA